MVLLWKRLCGLCASTPPGDHESTYPDLRLDVPLFEIARSFKVPAKRKCPVCPECVLELTRISEYVARCNQSQDFINVCSQQKIHKDEDVLLYREDFFKGNTTLPKVEKREKAIDWLLPVEKMEEEPAQSAAQFVEVVTTKQEEEEVAYLVEEVVPIPEMLKQDLTEEIIEEAGEEPHEIIETAEQDNEEETADEGEECEDDEEPIDEVERSSSTEVTQQDPFKKAKRVKVQSFTSRGPYNANRKWKQNIKCKHCDLILHSKHHLALHEKKHSPKPVAKPTNICEVCGKAFNAPSMLRAHATIHTDERPFPCDKCSMAFKNAYGLKCHQETHDSNKYICPICGLALGTNHTYHAHLKIHSDQRKYKCPVCPKSFKRHQPLKEHLFGHTDIRPYRCPFCEKTFVNGSSCRLHKVRLHPKELAELEASGRNDEVLNEHRSLPTLEEIKAIICAKYGIGKPAGESSSNS